MVLAGDLNSTPGSLLMAMLRLMLPVLEFCWISADKLLLRSSVDSSVNTGYVVAQAGPHVVLAGDLNSTPESLEVAMLRLDAA